MGFVIILTRGPDCEVVGKLGNFHMVGGCRDVVSVDDEKKGAKDRALRDACLGGVRIRTVAINVGESFSISEEVR